MTKWIIHVPRTLLKAGKKSNALRNKSSCQAQWHPSVIPNTWEAEAGRAQVWGQVGQHSKTLKITIKKGFGMGSIPNTMGGGKKTRRNEKKSS